MSYGASKASESELQLNDPVFVDASTTSAGVTSGPTSPLSVSSPSAASTGIIPLQGVVAYLGPVHFVKSNPDEWIGIRLTGSSVGLGKNDGSVKSVRYFPDCGVNGGIFVKRSSVSKRTLTKLEEVRLKRELSKSVSSSSIADANQRMDIKSATNKEEGTFRARRSSDGDILSPKRIISASSDQKTLNRSLSGNAPFVSPTAVKTKPSGFTPQTNRVQFNAPSASRLKLDSTSPRSNSVPRLTLEVSSPVERDVSLSLNQSTSSDARGMKFSPRNADPKTTSLEKSIQALHENLSVKDNQIQFLQQRLRQYEEASSEATQSRDNTQLNLEQLHKQLDTVKEENRRLKIIADTYAKTHLDQELTIDLNTSSNIKNPSRMDVSLPTLRQELIQTQIQLNQLQGDYHTLASQKELVEQQLAQNVREYQSFRENSTREQNKLLQDIKQTEIDLVQSLGQKNALQHKLDQRNEQMSEKDNTKVEHYKEVVHLQTEVSILQRRLVEMEKEKMDKDVVIEEMNIEKVQMEELIEILEDKVEELRIDAESAEIELDELRIELDEVRESSKHFQMTGVLDSSIKDMSNSGDGQDDPKSVSSDYDTRQALAIQNTRLREALTQLREQSVREKMDLQRQLRTAEKEADASSSKQEEYSRLKSDYQRLRDEVDVLKEMVDQSSNFEHMVEKLTDQIMILEEEKLNLESLVKDLEESIEIGNDMEEAQSEEMKAMAKDLQFRDTLILNLEEGLKMIKRREQEYQRSIGNYRASIEKLQQEKNALLELQKDGDGAKINYLAASKKALSYAARLVKEVTRSRKRDSEALNERIASQVNGYLSDRLEILLPKAIAAPEITAIKGEMFAASTALKISLGLSLINDICNTDLAKGRDYIKTLNLTSMTKASRERCVETTTLTESQQNSVQQAINHTKFMKLLIMSSVHVHRFLTAGIWPGVLSMETSLDLASSAVSIFSPLDSIISDNLKIFMEDGNLTLHRSNLSQLEQCINNIPSSSTMTFGNTGLQLIPDNWSPRCLDLYRDLSYSKFMCLCSSSILNALITAGNDSIDEDTIEQDVVLSFVALALGQLDSICAEANKMNNVLAGLDITNEVIINELFPLVRDWRLTCSAMIDAFESTLLRPDVAIDQVAKLESAINSTQKSITKASAYVLNLNLPLDDGVIIHNLSPENKDPWKSIRTEIGKMLDEEKLNHMKRARTLRKQLLAAVEKESKLSIAEAKILQYEKILATKATEISIQNLRIEELEGILSQMSFDVSSKEANSSTPTQELILLTEENRMLSEAVRYLQDQVDEYENDAMSQKGRGQSKTPNNIDLTFDTETVDREFTADSSVSRISLEAALFRPALFTASCTSSAYSVRALNVMMHKLPPLSDSAIRPLEEVEELVSCSTNLTLAQNDMRLLKSSIQLVRCPDHWHPYQSMKRTWAFIDDEKNKVSKAMRRLEESSSSAHHIIGLLEATQGRIL